MKNGMDFADYFQSIRGYQPVNETDENHDYGQLKLATANHIFQLCLSFLYENLK